MVEGLGVKVIFMREGSEMRWDDAEFGIISIWETVYPKNSLVS